MDPDYSIFFNALMDKRLKKYNSMLSNLQYSNYTDHLHFDLMGFRWAEKWSEWFETLMVDIF